MEPAEFALFLLEVLVAGFFLAAINGAMSENPLKTIPLLLAVTVAIVAVVGLIGIMCYVIVWAWGNPLIVVAIAVCGFVVHEYFWVKPKCVSE